MRLEELYLDGFGRFHQKTIKISEPVTVLYGPNEAGKSTILAFVRAILFGFPTRGRGEHYPPLDGGRHGGRVQFSDDTGAVYTLERFAGPHGGAPTLRTEAGEALDVATTLPRLTASATPDLFKTVFAFSLDELQEAASLQGSSIYSAGQGAPKLPSLRKSLRDRKGQIYSSRRSKQEIPGLLNDLNDATGKLRAVEDNAIRFGELSARESAIGLELQAADDELLTLNGRRAEVDDLVKGLDDWVALSALEEQLRDMRLYEKFPENAITRLDNFQTSMRQAIEDRAEAAEKLGQAEKAASDPIPGENLLNDAGKIEGIRRDRGSFDGSVRDLPERQADLQRLEAEFGGHLEDLGHNWSESGLESLDTSHVVRNDIERWKQRTVENVEFVRQARDRLEPERQRLQELESENRDAREKLPPNPPTLTDAEFMARQDALRNARGRLGEYEQLRQNHGNLRTQVNTLAANRESSESAHGRPKFAMLILLGLAGVVLIMAGLWFGGGALPMGILSGSVLLVVASILYWGKQYPGTKQPQVSSALEKQAADAESAADAARKLLIESAAALDLAEQPTTATLDSVQAHLDFARDELNAWKSANYRLEEASRRQKLQEQRVESGVQVREAAEASMQEAQKEWRQWLRKRDLAETLTADSMNAFLANVETARTSLREVRRMRDRVAAIGVDIDQFREKVEPLAVTHGIAFDPGDRQQLASAADDLIGRLDKAQSDLARREQDIRQADEARRALERQDGRLQLAEQELADW